MDAFEKLEKVGEGAYDKVYIAREKSCWVCSVAMPISSIKLMDVKQGISKTRDMVLYLVFEYMDTDLKKFIRSFRQTRENIHLPTVKGYDDIPKKIQDADVKKVSFLIKVINVPMHGLPRAVDIQSCCKGSSNEG
ncbi:cyclin-dependent kinase B2-1-like isoform X2 [Daucus carota subsp. sativus]|uniref:cyclin-dependent kinase B2-1-like isoform X2 n=1 Tax=Daucus carota subsp. sativus TaxID=79200 RepID=UPI003083D3C4